MLTRAIIFSGLSLITLSGFGEQPAVPETNPVEERQAFDYRNLAYDGWSTRELVKAAEEGDFEAAMRLVSYWDMIREEGERVSPEILEARFWYRYWLKKAEASGHPAPKLYLEALRHPEEIFDNPGHLPQPVTSLVEECRKLAEEGDLASINTLADLLGTPSAEQLTKWYASLKKKADSGDLNAKAVLANAYILGRASNEAFFADGLKYAREAAEGGNISGMNTYGYILTINLDNANAGEKGLEWLEKAADAGHIGAMETLLNTMHNEDEVPDIAKIRQREVRYTKELCDRGQLDTMISESQRLVETGEAPQAGLKLLDQCAEMGSFTALDLLAKYYQDNDYYVPTDLEKTVFYAKRLADLGGGQGYLKLGLSYEHGRGVPKDPAKAYEYVSRACAMGLNEAFVEQARMIIKKCGTQAPPEEALSILTSLANERAPPKGTHFLLSLINEGGLGIRPDDNKAIECYNIGADLGDTKSMNNLAAMYEMGKGTKKDLSMAQKWYAEAARLGNTDAAANLERLLKKKAN